MPTAAYAVEHYENFPVASLLLPRHMRRPVQIVYRFARSADDFADEGDRTACERLALLGAYRDELCRIARAEMPHMALFHDLRDEVIAPFGVPHSLFLDLLDAFSQDVTKVRYADFDELLDYAKRSANPVGRIVLHLARAATPEHLAWSDDICTALQLINFWQDVAIDWQKGRVYLPQSDLARFGVTEADIARGETGANWKALLGYQVGLSRQLLRQGWPLGDALRGRLGLEIRLTVQGGARILHKIERAGFDVFQHRPILTARDWPVMLLRAVLFRTHGRL